MKTSARALTEWVQDAIRVVAVPEDGVTTITRDEFKSFCRNLRSTAGTKALANFNRFLKNWWRKKENKGASRYERSSKYRMKMLAEFILWMREFFKPDNMIRVESFGEAKDLLDAKVTEIERCVAQQKPMRNVQVGVRA